MAADTDDHRVALVAAPVARQKGGQSDRWAAGPCVWLAVVSSLRFEKRLRATAQLIRLFEIVKRQVGVPSPTGRRA